MLVYKFKGAVMQDQDSLKKVKNRVESQQEPCVVVVSALQGVMPLLRSIYSKSVRKGSGFEEEFMRLKALHMDLAQQWLAEKKYEEYEAEMQQHLNELEEILHQVAVLKENSYSMKDYILSKGDILSSLLFSKLFPQAIWKDSRNFILTDGNFGAPEILWEESCGAAVREFKDLQGIAVVPGYCGKTKAGYTISLGPVGLSLTASVLDAAFMQVKVA